MYTIDTYAEQLVYGLLMNIEQAKQIPIVEVLERLGHAPHRQARGQLWYFSPFRNEATPSFKDNPSAYIWYDFGEGSGEDVIDIVMRAERLNSVSEGLARIDQIAGGATPPVLPRQHATREPQSPIELTSIGPVCAKSLIAYLRKRGIDPHLAAPYVQEAHYRRGDKAYFALAFANDSGGYELRNPYFKGTLNAKDITVIPGDRDRVLVFEGFFDYLTAVTLSGGLPGGTVLSLIPSP